MVKDMLAVLYHRLFIYEINLTCIERGKMDTLEYISSKFCNPIPKEHLRVFLKI